MTRPDQPERPLRLERLEDRLTPDASVADIRNALDLPDGSDVIYNGDPRAVAVLTRRSTGSILGFPSGRDEDLLVLSTGVAAALTSGTGTGTDLGMTPDAVRVNLTIPVPKSSFPQKLLLDYRFLTNEPPDPPTPPQQGVLPSVDVFEISATDTFATLARATPADATGSAPGTFFAHAGYTTTVQYPIPAGVTMAHLTLTIMDKENHDAVDSAVLVDNVRFQLHQVVYLDFGGGSAGSVFGTLNSATISQFQSHDVRSNDPVSGIEGTIVWNLANGPFYGFDIEFVTDKPASGDYMHVVIGGFPDVPITIGDPLILGDFSHPTPTTVWDYYRLNHPNATSLEGQSQGVDVGNRNHADTAVVFAGQIGIDYKDKPSATILQELTVAIAHEIGHNLGLRHETDDNAASIMKNTVPLDPNGTFQNTFNATVEGERADYKDGATQQNAFNYLMGVLGPARGGQTAVLYPPPPDPLEFQLDFSTLSRPVYGLQIGIATGAATPLSVDAGSDGSNTQPINYSTDAPTGGNGPPAIHFEIPGDFSNPSFFLYGSSTPGGPIDIFSGVPLGGVLHYRDNFVSLFGPDGNPVSSIPLSFGTPGQLQPIGSATLQLIPPVIQPPSAPSLSTAYAFGQDAGGTSLVGAAGGVDSNLTAFPGFSGGVRVAVADFNQDGEADLVVGTGPGAPTRIRIIDGVTQTDLFSVQPFEPAFTGGVFVSAGDLTGDGVPDLIVTPDEGGGPRVQVYDGKTFAKVADFFGIDDPKFRGGARTAVGDINGDGVPDLIVAAGFGGGPRLAVYDGKSATSGRPVRLFNDFFVFEQTLRNGVFVTAGDLNGDGFADVIVGGGPGGGPRVLALSGKDLTTSGSANPVQLANFFAGDPTSRGGVRVAAKDLDGDNRADLVTGAGAGGAIAAYVGSAIPVDGQPPELWSFADAFPGFTGGVFVG
jgi:hypothetical protein